MHNRLSLALDPTYLKLILFPTEKCNFRCLYCYEDFEKGRMERKIIEGIKNLITLRAPELTKLNIDWFGGEPLLAKDIVIEILSHAKDLREEYGFSLLSSITTNGYTLDPTTILNIGKICPTEYQISFDGYRDYHNSKRFINHKDGSFDSIWKNICSFNELRKSGKLKSGRITLRLHVHTDNQSSLLELINQINLNLDPQFFHVFLKNIAHLGSKNDDKFSILDDTSSIHRHKELNEQLSKFRLVSLNKSSPYICYASMPNSFAIRPDGSLAKCTVALKSPKNHLGYLTPEGTFDFNKETFTPWIKSFQTLDPAVLACPLHYIEKN
ncbi:radical SAM protein [Saccharibacter sp. 17.LH.SD]|uniref:radical SAM protein n=1 Tax=Saccharibacter sp. 17.LH.SD TaxID=2689393 RepID=UPI0013688E76|nr:radical SAM protein [Saccharibacter sp. 17.LH.SD]MXV44868.1 radical SAM protein [Saccharibacter sp. 17.LH.SD]